MLSTSWSEKEHLSESQSPPQMSHTCHLHRPCRTCSSRLQRSVWEDASLEREGRSLAVMICLLPLPLGPFFPPVLWPGLTGVCNLSTSYDTLCPSSHP